ncbi:MAG: hypothetical protein ACI87Q_001621 [Pseudohongiellaceae bacterium]|jgi:hypothetical protein
MKSKHIRHIVVGATAGKAALTIGSASAQSCLDQPGLGITGDSAFYQTSTTTSGKGADATSSTEATLYQMGFAASSTPFGSTATLNVKLNQLTTSKPSDVYVAYSPTQVTESQLGAACSGEFLLDLSTMRILDGFKVNHIRSLGLSSETPLGALASGPIESIAELEVQLNLNTLLSDPSLQTNEVFLQVIAFESGRTSFDTASVSSVQKITLNRDDPAPVVDDSTGGDSTTDGGNSKTT